MYQVKLRAFFQKHNYESLPYANAVKEAPRQTTTWHSALVVWSLLACLVDRNYEICWEPNRKWPEPIPLRLISGNCCRKAIFWSKNRDFLYEASPGQVSMNTYGGFSKWGYLQIIHFRLGFSILNHRGTPHFRKLPSRPPALG